MLKYLILTMLITGGQCAMAQYSNLVECTEDPFNIPLSPEPVVSTSVQTKFDRRQRNFDFYRNLQTMQDPSYVTPFLSWTRNNMGYDKKNFVLDADLQIPISIGGKRFGLNTIQVIPRFKVRIFQNDLNVPLHEGGDESLPVRTPSAMPGIAYYFSTKSLWKSHEARSKSFFGIYAFHHSNGQDGSEYDEKTGKINVYNGNFGENLVFEFLFGQRFTGSINYLDVDTNNPHIKTPKLGEVFKIVWGKKVDWYYKVGYEEHFKGLTNAYFLKKNMYGRHRLNAYGGAMFMSEIRDYITDKQQNSYQFCSWGPSETIERWRLTWNMNYILDSEYYRGETVTTLNKVKVNDIKKRLNLWLTAYHIIGRSKFAAIFAQAGYFGSDNYNIYFNESLFHFKLGFAFGFFDQIDNN
jgi:hypothetical protein